MLVRRGLWSIALAGLLTLFACGCGGAKAVKVSGSVTLDGKPLSGATITFNPVDKAGRNAFGRTESDGSFRLTTFRTDDGALPGDYQVTVAVAQEIPEHVSGGNPYEMSPEQQKAFFTRAAPGTKAAQAKKKGIEVPVVYADPLKTPLKEKVPTNGDIKIELRSTAR